MQFEENQAPAAYTSFFLGGQNICTIGRNMYDVMSKTDMDLTVEDIKMPLGKDVIYFESDHFKCMIPDQDTGLHKLKGVLVSKQERGINIMLWGEPKLRKDGSYSDSFITVELLADKSKISDKLVCQLHYLDFLKNSDMFYKASSEIYSEVSTVLNSLMYWSSHDEQSWKDPKWTELENKIADIKQKLQKTKKKGYRKLLHRQLKEANKQKKDVVARYYIECAPIQSKTATTPKGTHKSPVQHLRRGHWRKYQSGKIVWIKPMIINAGGKLDSRKKIYRSKHDANV